LTIPRQTVFEEGEIMSISSELLSLNSTPVPHENLTFMIFGDQEKWPLEVILGETNEQGISNLSVEAPTHGTVTIVAVFNGTLIFNCSSDTYSIIVLPKFTERLPSYLLSAVLACLAALTTITIARKTRRKLKWNSLSVSRDSDQERSVLLTDWFGKQGQ
jgi:hypothetical protein